MYGTDKMLKTITIVLLVTSAVSTRVSVSAGTNPKSIIGFARTANVTIGNTRGPEVLSSIISLQIGEQVL